MENSKRTAFPITDANCAEIGDIGLTKREYIAAKAMQGMLSCRAAGVDATVWWKRILRIFFPEHIQTKWCGSDYRQIAEASIRYADELLKQLETSKP